MQASCPPDHEPRGIFSADISGHGSLKIAVPAHAEPPVRRLKRLPTAVKAAGNDQAAIEFCQLAAGSIRIHAHRDFSFLIARIHQSRSSRVDECYRARPGLTNRKSQDSGNPSGPSTGGSGVIGEQKKWSLSLLETLKPFKRLCIKGRGRNTRNGGRGMGQKLPIAQQSGGP